MGLAQSAEDMETVALFQRHIELTLNAIEVLDEEELQGTSSHYQKAGFHLTCRLIRR